MLKNSEQEHTEITEGSCDQSSACSWSNLNMISPLQHFIIRFGYLMSSSSRERLPANLQGLWNNNNPPWRCDYHSDVNVQMNFRHCDPPQGRPDTLLEQTITTP